MLGVTLCWGLTFPMIKLALEGAGPLTFMALRFPLAFLILWPLTGWKIPSRSSVAPGLLLSLFLGASYYAQVEGLVYTTPTRSAFITGLSAIFVPLLYPVLTRRLPGRLPAAGAVVATAGLFLVTSPEGGALGRGEVLTLGCALGYALYIVTLEKVGKRVPYQDLVLVQILALSVAFLPGALFETVPVVWGSSLLWGLATTAPILAVTLVLQNRYQHHTTATRAAVIFTAEPVFAAGFSFLVFGEVLGGWQWLGAFLILLGILAAIRH